tara:strand:+ start:70 stop:639 length:570 start_codon:yes stop_codon:yes gene_type:complete
MPGVYVKILLLFVFSVFFIGFIEYVYAQIQIPSIADDPVVDVYLGLLFILLVVIIPSIVFAYKKHKKNSIKPPQTKLTDSGTQPNVNLVCSKCGFETDDKDTFEMHHRDEKFECIKGWAGRKYYGGKWFDKDENPSSSDSTLLESKNISSYEENEPKMKQNFCTNCGKLLNPSAKFCGKCGTATSSINE